MRRGFAPILLILPIALIMLSTIVITKVRGSPPILNTRPISLSRSITQSPSPPALKVSESSPSPAPSLSPSPQADLQIEYQTFAHVAPSPSPSPSPSPQITSSTSSGANYTVATFDLGAITVVTDSANDDDCANNCPTKALAQYVSENGGRAGINGTYFCPPDYSSCAGKVNSFDFAIWNNRKKKWMNSSTLFWNGRGMFVFRPGSAQFFSCAACSGAPSDITGGLTNYPALLAGGKDVLDEGSLPDSLKVTKGTRGGIGTGGGKLFLVVARSANMRDLVNIFRALGAVDAMNLDGGGSTALFDGGYKAGPGRSLPNAIIVK